MTRDEAIAKIKKCLALGRSTQPHEAGAAMRQAQKLMQIHGVTQRDVDLAEVCEAKARAASSAANRWDVLLSRICAEAFGCERFAELTGGYNGSGAFVRSRGYVFVGVGFAAELAAYSYTTLSRQCARARMAHIKAQPRNCKPITKTARGDSFAEGWAISVSSLVERFARPERDEQLLLDYMAANHADLESKPVRDNTKRRSLSDGHFLAGHLAGQDAQLHRGVGAKAGPAQIGMG